MWMCSVHQLLLHFWCCHKRHYLGLQTSLFDYQLRSCDFNSLEDIAIISHGNNHNNNDHNNNNRFNNRVVVGFDMMIFGIHHN